MSTPPENPKIYHIVHVDRLPSIVGDGYLWSDAEMQGQTGSGTTIGMNSIKQRRLNELTLASHPGLHVGECVPFYFCPRSVMLYLISMGNHPELSFKGGQPPVIHLEADFHAVVQWANTCSLRWAFTTSNAGAYYFDDYAEPGDLDKIDWDAVQATDWRNHKDGKQAEFLVEGSFSWSLVERIGVYSSAIRDTVHQALASTSHKPEVRVMREWYY